MEWAALISWIVTAGGGFVLLTIWLSRGGMRQREGAQIRPVLILSHFALAATGLVLWIVYVFNDSDALAWTAFGILVAVAALGFTMFAIWWRRRQAGAGPVAVPAEGSTEQPAEQHFPVPIVALHGLLAVTTLVLVLLSALEV